MPAVKIFFPVFLICSTLFFSNLFAQEDDPELITDRPDITESASIVYPGWLQIETGFSLLNDNFVDETVVNDLIIYNLAGTLLRYGISGSVELRAGGAYQIFKSTKGINVNKVTGISDLIIGKGMTTR